MSNTKRQSLRQFLNKLAARFAARLNGRAYLAPTGTWYITFGAPFNSRPIPYRVIRISNHPASKSAAPCWADIVIPTIPDTLIYADETLLRAERLRFPWRKCYRESRSPERSE